MRGAFGIHGLPSRLNQGGDKALSADKYFTALLSREWWILLCCYAVLWSPSAE